jgi:hypothetical protein
MRFFVVDAIEFVLTQVPKMELDIPQRHFECMDLSHLDMHALFLRSMVSRAARTMPPEYYAARGVVKRRVAELDV